MNGMITGTWRLLVYFILQYQSRFLDPQAHDELAQLDFFCQHPRWNLQVQGQPLSIYMRYNAVRKETTYIISHKQKDTSIRALRKMIDVALKSALRNHCDIFLTDPFDFLVMLSTLSFEASKYHVKRFQRFMWTQVGNLGTKCIPQEANSYAYEIRSTASTIILQGQRPGIARNLVN
jgi:hypothetical protein